MKLHRRRILQLAAGAAAVPVLPRAASALDYPTRPVRLIVGYTAGSAPDIAGRLIGQSLSDRLGQQFITENKPGAGTNLSTEAVVRAAPDGYTLLLVATPNTLSGLLHDNLSFDFVRDIAPVGYVGTTPFVMIVHAVVPGADRRRIHRLCQGQSGQGQHGLQRHRQPHPYFRRAVQDDGRRRPVSRAVPRRAGGAGRSARRPRPGHVRSDHLVPGPDQSRQAPGAGGDDAEARRFAARHPDRGRYRAGLRGHRRIGHRRAARYAGRDHRQAQ